jgi:hypothetical protein
VTSRTICGHTALNRPPMTAAGAGRKKVRLAPLLLLLTTCGVRGKIRYLTGCCTADSARIKEALHYYAMKLFLIAPFQSSLAGVNIILPAFYRHDHRILVNPSII